MGGPHVPHFWTPVAWVAPLFQLHATETDHQFLTWSPSIHLPVLVLTKDGERRWSCEGRGGLLACLYPTVLEEDARLALQELERVALLQTLRQTMGTEAGGGLREAGKGILGRMGGFHSYESCLLF